MIMNESKLASSRAYVIILAHICYARRMVHKQSYILFVRAMYKWAACKQMQYQLFKMDAVYVNMPLTAWKFSKEHQVPQHPLLH